MYQYDCHPHEGTFTDNAPGAALLHIVLMIGMVPLSARPGVASQQPCRLRKDLGYIYGAQRLSWQWTSLNRGQVQDWCRSGCLPTTVGPHDDKWKTRGHCPSPYLGIWRDAVKNEYLARPSPSRPSHHYQRSTASIHPQVGEE
jgi:hypothetical protein